MPTLDELRRLFSLENQKAHEALALKLAAKRFGSALAAHRKRPQMANAEALSIDTSWSLSGKFSSDGSDFLFQSGEFKGESVSNLVKTKRGRAYLLKTMLNARTGELHELIRFEFYTIGFREGIETK